MMRSAVVIAVAELSVAPLLATDQDSLAASWPLATGIVAAVAAISAALGGLIAKALPAFGQWRKDLAAAVAQQRQADADADARMVASATDAARAEAAMKKDAYEAVHADFSGLFDRQEREIARLTGVLEQYEAKMASQDARIADIYGKFLDLNAEHTKCQVQNERLLSRLVVVEAKQKTLEAVDAVSSLPTRLEAIVVTDREGKVKEWSPPATVIFQYRPKDIIGKNVSLIIPPERLAEHLKAVKEVVESGRAVKRGPYHVEAVKKDGTRLPVEITLSSWSDGGEQYFAAAIRPMVRLEGGDAPLSELAASPSAVISAVREVVVAPSPVPPPTAEPKET
jgi:PAS domain S-box-containing protein